MTCKISTTVGFGLNLVQFNYVVLCVFSVLKRGRVVMGVCLLLILFRCEFKMDTCLFGGGLEYDRLLWRMLFRCDV